MSVVFYLGLVFFCIFLQDKLALMSEIDTSFFINKTIVYIKDKNLNWFQTSVETCLHDEFYEFLPLNSFFTEDGIKNDSQILFTTCNYAESQEIILDFVIGTYSYVTLEEQNCLQIVAYLDKETMSLISDTVAPYSNIFLMDFNPNNMAMNYKLNSFRAYLPPIKNAILYFITLLKITKFVYVNILPIEKDDEFLLFTEQYADLCYVEYTVHFQNISYMYTIADELGSLVEHLFVACSSIDSLKTFLSICETNRVEIGTIILYGDAYMSANLILWEKKKNPMPKHNKIYLYWTIPNIEYFHGFCLSYMNLNFLWIADFYELFQNLYIYAFEWKDAVSRFKGHSSTVYSDLGTNIVIFSECNRMCPSGYQQQFNMLVNKTDLNGKRERSRPCSPCRESYFKEGNSTDECKKCPLEYISNENKTKCKDYFSLSFTSFNSVEGWITTSLSALNFIFGSFILTTLVFKRKTPVVKSANLTLCSAQIVCHLFISFLVPILYVKKLLFVICCSRHLVVGFLLTASATIVYIKTGKYYSIFHKTYRMSKKEMLVSSSIDMVKLSLVLIVQSMMGITLLIKSPTTISYNLNYEKMTRSPECSTDSQFALQIVYVGILLLVCSIQSFRTRNLPSYFNETLSIAYSAVASCVTLVSYFPLYYGNNDINTRSIATALVILTTNLTLMGIMFTPKLFVIYFSSGYNTKSNFRNEMINYSKSIVSR